ncbi:Threonine/homoserine/homoserine lactone efflux protein [Tistlia consotensis]|uniref:Threonine/homoserine/homoserine lactone efflux protein n=1 Tax=Tistlia consotensis USBA 355 TaxID=560819 RepID=A0A1Y6BX32_9PROT|nr:LysE family translocator [Tistlia consotensis]SMF33768.1 Threonine/homoserine/homoserine lactone efflux protein [Tistlia consotensis USBA 355]SNR70338.1 Threonine/homoserine/homoserine lactone efflux protein [Tistlia consotensis]
MPPVESLLAFAAATLVFAYLPGPAILYTAAQTLARGRRGGLRAALGIHCGGYLHVATAALGLSAILLHVPAAYAAVKLAGAAYLVWLGLQTMRRRIDLSALPAVAGRSARRAFLESMLVEVLNPKAALFFLAFLPQFVDPSAGLPVWAQLLLLGTAVNLTFSSADLLTVALTDRVLAGIRRSEGLQRLARWAGGGLLVGLGLHLGLSER